MMTMSHGQCTSTVHKYQASQETITSHYFTYLFKRCPHFICSIYFNSHITNISWSKDKNNISSSDTCCCPTVIQIAPSKYFIQMCSNKRTTIKKFQKLTSIYPYQIFLMFFPGKMKRGNSTIVKMLLIRNIFVSNIYTKPL